MYEAAATTKTIHSGTGGGEGYSLHGTIAQFAPVWQAKLTEAKIIDTTNEKLWQNFFLELEREIASITFHHRLGSLSPPKGGSVYFNIDRIIYTTTSGETVHVNYPNVFYMGGLGEGEMYLSKYANDRAEKDRLAPFRDVAKKNFFGAVAGMVTTAATAAHYRLGLFLLTYERTLCMSVDEQANAAVKKLCVIL